MKRIFDTDAVRAQIENLRSERDRIDQAIYALEGALKSIEGLELQRELPLVESRTPSDISLVDAVKNVCVAMQDGITRQRVLVAIERQYPFLKPVPSSVSAALINLSRGDEPMLKIATAGEGRRPSFYSTQGDMDIKLTADEIETLMDPTLIRGTGGWQSLWTILRREFNKETGTISLTPALRARIFHYYYSYGVGGWQARVKRVFRRELPHLFAA